MGGGGGTDNGERPTSPALPDGTVTFLFTDVVGSTDLWEQAARAMRQSMVEHDQLIETAVEANGGTLVRPRGEGDSRFAVFRRASDAVHAAVQIVGAIETATWSTPSPIQVRVGLHTGEADLRDGDYYGTAVNLCARIRGLAGPNQVFVSEATGQLLMRSDSEVELRDVGTHQIKGLARPERVYSLVLQPGSLPAGTSGKKRTASVRAPDYRIATPWFRRRTGRIVVGVVVVVLVIAAVVIVTRPTSNNALKTVSPPPMPHGYTPRLRTARCSSGISSAIATARCSFLIVPQDRQHPDAGPKVHVAVTIVPPLASATPAAPPTIDIGGSDSLVDSPARSRSEYILVQPRGFAPDTPALSCPEVEGATRTSLAKPTSDVAAIAAITAAYAACYQRSIRAGVDPSNFNYDTMADDLVDLMAVLRIAQVNIVTGDSDSHIAFGVLEKVPRAVRTLTLDNPEPAGGSSYTDPVADLAASLQHYVNLCEADAQCSSAFPNLIASFESQVSGLTASPVLARSDNEAFGSESNVSGSAKGASAPSVSVLIDGDRWAQASQEAIGAFTNSFFPILAAGISNPPATLVADLVDNYSGTSRYPSNGVYVPYPFGVLASENCSYDIHVLARGAAISAQQLPAFAGVAVGQTFNQICSVWKVASVPNFYFTGVASAVPTLIVRGRLSPYGTDAFPDEVKQSLPSAKVGLFSTIGENVLGEAPPCLDTLRRAFLANPAARLDLAGCAAQSPPIKFVDTP